MAFGSNSTFCKATQTAKKTSRYTTSGPENKAGRCISGIEKEEDEKKAHAMKQSEIMPYDFDIPAPSESESESP